MKLLKLLVLTVMMLLSGPAEGKRIVGYVTSWSDVIPDPSLLTNINYAFGHVNDSFDGVRVENPERLREIVRLKKKRKNLEVQLSIGGWGSGGFSEMAADSLKRRLFAEDCRRIVDEFNLDGIDIDWEYPGSGVAGISSSSGDRQNFILLMRDLRAALGKNRLLTFASPATVGFYEFKPLMEYVDFVNIMTYDMNRSPYHHSALFRSNLSGSMTVDESVRAHISGGVPPEKIMLGVPFYGHGKKGVYPDFVSYPRISPREGEELKYDEIAEVPYIVDSEGELIMSFDDPRSLKRKAEYVKDNGLGGMMFWDYSQDTKSNELLKTIKKGLK